MRALKSGSALFMALLLLTGFLTFSSALLQASVKLSSNGSISLPGGIRPLHVEGRWIMDDYGNTLHLRGVAAGGFTFVDHYASNLIPMGDTFPARIWNNLGSDPASNGAVIDNLDAVKNWGGNIVRVLFPPYYWKFDTATRHFRQNLHDLLNWAAERGIYVVLAGYQVLPYGMGGGQDDLPYPPYQTGSNPDGTNPDALATIGSQQDFIDLMADTATQLQNHPNLIFELWNEPIGDQTAEDSWLGTDGVVQRSINAIRATGAENLILIQWGYGLDGSNYDIYFDFITAHPLVGNNLIYGAHSYIEVFNPQRIVDYSWVKQRLDPIRQVQDEWGKPVYIGETGANNDVPEEGDLWGLELRVFNEWGVHYTAWWWRDSGMYRLLEYGAPYVPPPSENGLVLMTALSYAPTQGWLQVNSNISGKSVVLSPSGLSGTAPVIWQLNASTYTVTVSSTGFKQWNDGSTNPTKQVTIQAGQATILTATYTS